MSMGRYEIIYILAPNTPEDTMNDLVDRFESEVISGGGILLRVEKWGRKKLAYEVRKFREGFFVLFVTDCEGALVDELERRFRMTDQVIKFMTVRIDEELKRAGKMAVDEEIGKAVETERIDRSRRSGPKPPVRTEVVEGDGKPASETVVEKAGDKETAETEAATAVEDAAPDAEPPATEVPVEEIAKPAESVEPVVEDDDGSAEGSDDSEEK